VGFGMRSVSGVPHPALLWCGRNGLARLNFNKI